MSPGSGVKSEYMKRYREPCWDEYAPCYRERLHYRLGRRLLEQAHAPWLWDDWGPAGASDDSASSASSGAGSPAPQCAPDSPPPPAEPGAPEEPARDAEAGDAEAGDAEAGDAEAGDAEAGDAEATSVSALPVKDVKEKPEQPVKTKETDRLPSCEARQQQGAVFGRGAGKAVRSPQRSSSKTKEKKRPFALYGWGEKQMDTGSQRTHNVLASAPVSEVPSACPLPSGWAQAASHPCHIPRSLGHRRDSTVGQGNPVGGICMSAARSWLAPGGLAALSLANMWAHGQSGLLGSWGP
uniref:Centriole, cilia and spindle associated protein n=1 Tax=Rhinolophus ferrumequinum TaxID=59479 RepID=A0A671FDH4_RHIFE